MQYIWCGCKKKIFLAYFHSWATSTSVWKELQPCRNTILYQKTNTQRNYQVGPSKLVRFVKISSISLCFPMWAVLSEPCEEESARRSGARVPTSRFAGRHRRLPSPPPIPRQVTEKPRKGPGQQRWGGYLPVLGFDVRTCPYHKKTLDSAWSFVPLDRTLVHVGPAKLQSLRIKWQII